MFKNRPDRTIYRSFVYETDVPSNADTKLFERNYNKEIKIKKMTQKFELDDDISKPPSS